MWPKEVDASEVEVPWWHMDGSGESDEDVERRVRGLARQILFSDAETIVIVTHSLLIREIFATLLAPSFCDREPQLSSRLQREKVRNCELVRCVFDFGQQGAACLMPIVQVDRSKVGGHTASPRARSRRRSCGRPRMLRSPRWAALPLDCPSGSA